MQHTVLLRASCAVAPKTRDAGQPEMECRLLATRLGTHQLASAFPQLLHCCLPQTLSSSLFSETGFLVPVGDLLEFLLQLQGPRHFEQARRTVSIQKPYCGLLASPARKNLSLGLSCNTQVPSKDCGCQPRLTGSWDVHRWAAESTKILCPLGRQVWAVSPCRWTQTAFKGSSSTQSPLPASLTSQCFLDTATALAGIPKSLLLPSGVTLWLSAIALLSSQPC